MDTPHNGGLPDGVVGTGRTTGVAESVIREMTREAIDRGAINLSQGIPDEDETPPEIKRAAKEAIDTDSQYTITWGCPNSGRRSPSATPSGRDRIRSRDGGDHHQRDQRGDHVDDARTRGPR